MDIEHAKNRIRSGIQLVTFRLGDERYGIPVWKVREIIRPVQMFPIPGMKEPVQGVINLRGEIIPVLQIHSLLNVQGGKSGGDDKQRRIIILELERGGIGIWVDDVSEVIRVASKDVKSAPDIGKDTPGQNAMMGIVNLSGSNAQS